CIAASQLHSTPAAPTPDSTISPRPSVAQFPPPPTDPERASLRRASLAPPVRGNADAAMERLAKWATLDADPLRRTFANSGDLYGFVESHLARATAGDGAASYYIYLALDECRPYLRMNAEEARALAQRMQPDLSSAAVEEEQSWNRDATRCARFAGGDLSQIVATLGDQRPGAENEYGSVLFERAADAGFPPAVAERALREPGYDPAQRETMLRRALRSGNADVYWQLFRHSWSADAAQAPASLAWLIEACRNGYDCSADATWFRTGDCADGSEHCLPAQSALAHYWYSAPTSARESALALAQQIEAAAKSSRWDDVPMPAVRDLEQAFAESAMPIEE
ncbi:MAG TPA: hypothetical protein VFB36_00065, partial [Nevskiaceae bacterium]|nr:hypothetical protein [Nevskiaceae bacterium]